MLRVYWLVPAVLFWGIVLVIFDRESGLTAWTGLNEEFEASQARVETLQEEVIALRAEIGSLEDDPFAQERAIREELKLAQPGEVLVKFSLERNVRSDF